jgi:hypothetical protein
MSHSLPHTFPRTIILFKRCAMDRLGSSIMGALSASTHSISRATINDRQPATSTGVHEGAAVSISNNSLSITGETDYVRTQDGLSKRASRRSAEDLEVVPVGVSAYPDPFVIRSGFKTEGELAELRKRKKTGKKLAEYHRTQNEACPLVAQWHSLSNCRSIQLIENLLKPMEDHTHEAQEDEEGARLAVRSPQSHFSISHNAILHRSK